MAKDDRTEEVTGSSQFRAEMFRLESGDGIPWQRWLVSDRILVVTGGRGYCYRMHGRDELRDEVAAGDTILLRRMAWHRFLAAPGQTFTGTIVTHLPGDPEYRR